MTVTHHQADTHHGRQATAHQHSAVRLHRAMRTVLLAIATIGSIVLALMDGRLWALRAAGAFKGQAIAGIEHFVSALQGNLVWLGGTAMGLIIAVVAILFMAGHSRAHDVMLKTLIGVAILASISGIVA